MRVSSLNRSTVLVELADLDAVLALHASLVRTPLAGVHEIVPAARTLMLRFDPARWSRQTLAAALAQCDLSGATSDRGPSVEIPMRYDGEDLAEVAQLCGLSVDEVIRRHGAREYTVAFCGFSPGFGYLVGGDPMLQVPRRSTPRTRVPAGSVALGGVYCGVYPQASPGGWQLIGTTSIPMWHVERTTPAILTPGTRVKFVERDSVPSIEITPKEKSLIEPYLKVTAAALPALVQDLGRPGHAAIGVTASGALDRGSLRAANAMVGNPPDVAALEIALGNFACEIFGDTEIALAGAAVPIIVTRASGEIFDAVMQKAIGLRSGDRVKLGYPPRGVRTYLAVRGGFDAPKILGSSSSDVLAALGPAPLVKGSLVSIGRGSVERATTASRPAPSAPHAAQTLPKSDDVVVLDIFAGPRADWFGSGVLENFCTQVWRVTPRSNRVGLRLHGETPLMRQRTEELPSEGLTSGAIQVPHDGQPVLLLADHPVTGGYPVIAIVAEHHLDLAGQIPPSAKIRFRMLADL
ncbi:MAG: 5-oxoprolinase/urea amidolyase family protein [Gammaproteobacteria bacterium]|nr:5-oxoprolinase/urea amidolyase family protein [Gammaproteobacteria bacterium]